MPEFLFFYFLLFGIDSRCTQHKQRQNCLKQMRTVAVGQFPCEGEWVAQHAQIMFAGQTAPLGLQVLALVHWQQSSGKQGVCKEQEQSVVLISLPDNAILAKKHPISQSRLWCIGTSQLRLFENIFTFIFLDSMANGFCATIHGTTPLLLHPYSYSTIVHNHIDNGRRMAFH